MDDRIQIGESPPQPPPCPPASIDIRKPGVPDRRPPSGELTFVEQVILGALAIGVWLWLVVMCAGRFGAKP